MKAEFLKRANVKDEKEFYSMFPTEEAFFNAYPDMKQYKQGGANYSETQDSVIDKKRNVLMDFVRGNVTNSIINNEIKALDDAYMQFGGQSMQSYGYSPNNAIGMYEDAVMQGKNNMNNSAVGLFDAYNNLENTQHTDFSLNAMEYGGAMNKYANGDEVQSNTVNWEKKYNDLVKSIGQRDNGYVRGTGLFPMNERANMTYNKSANWDSFIKGIDEKKLMELDPRFSYNKKRRFLGLVPKDETWTWDFTKKGKVGDVAGTIPGSNMFDNAQSSIANQEVDPLSVSNKNDNAFPFLNRDASPYSQYIESGETEADIVARTLPQRAMNRIGSEGSIWAAKKANNPNFDKIAGSNASIPSYSIDNDSLIKDMYSNIFNRNRQGVNQGSDSDLDYGGYKCGGSIRKARTGFELPTQSPVTNIETQSPFFYSEFVNPAQQWNTNPNTGTQPQNTGVGEKGQVSLNKKSSYDNEALVNMGFAGMDMLTNMFSSYDNVKNQKRMDQLSQAHNNFMPQPGGNRGDYGSIGSNFGTFQPQNMTPVQFRGQNITQYQEGGEYDLSEAEILELLKNGGSIEFID